MCSYSNTSDIYEFLNEILKTTAIYNFHFKDMVGSIPLRISLSLDGETFGVVCSSPSSSD